MSQVANYVMKKSISERYEIRWPGEFTWAYITISEDGDFNAQSDYGNYQYAWRSFGEDFKQFLIKICSRCNDESMGYLYDKLHDRDQANRVDVEKTIHDYKRTLLQEYRLEFWRMSKEQKQAVRDCFDALREFEKEHDEVSQDFFLSQLMHETRITEETLCWEYIIYNVETVYDRRCEAFCRVIAPVFAEILENELKEKRVANAPAS
jgi:hypothetical protein